MLDYLAFAPYGWFIWPSFAVFAVLVGGVAVQTLVAARRTRVALRKLEQKTP